MNWISKLERKICNSESDVLCDCVVYRWLCIEFGCSGILLSVFVTEHRSGVSRADLEAGYIFDAATKFECIIYGVCIVFILYDRTSA